MTTVEEAARLDSDDCLAAARDHFVLPDGMVYLDGNSLGALSVDVSARLAEVLAVWSRQLIGGFADAGWWDAPMRVGDRIGGSSARRQGRPCRRTRRRCSSSTP